MFILLFIGVAPPGRWNYHYRKSPAHTFSW